MHRNEYFLAFISAAIIYLREFQTEAESSWNPYKQKNISYAEEKKDSI